MSAQLSTITRVGVAAVLALCVALPGATCAKNVPPEKNPVRSFNEILSPIANVDATIRAGFGATGPCEVPPVGGKKFYGAGRFVGVLYGVAYCDQETGLVWEVSPAAGFFNWAGAISHCATRQVGGRKGWSLPMREQLASLVDTNSVLCIGGGLCLPDSHPFQNVQSADYWSGSTTAGSPTFAWIVNFFIGGALVIDLEGNGHAWCVRDSPSYDGQGLAAIE